MPPHHQYHHSHSQSNSLPRTSLLPGASTSSASGSATKARQYAHLHSQLAQLNAHLADTENLVRMTAVQAGDMRFLGGYIGGMFMGAAKVLGEEGIHKEDGSGSGSGNGGNTAEERRGSGEEEREW
ncbi:hypothetical protein DTO166G4_8864 [Paecilomyces variotii]|nr:hypothetical protein DTO166G4_8864 [Paecilomyces variotii]KAJ9227925.1 hypothetical protein DTO166G5_8996 [Paecilomyces variotii]KAJ9254294.1 hypothetical protein DTO195F2_6659 [Paecilomyces variotii]KAJ9306596.1 hypothetical protein DTO217A2_3948 [Paecilomyces variotii]KAJ9367469.1 hypothetical protein DTO282E5_7842 [Paecilomyces variotii]